MNVHRVESSVGATPVNAYLVDTGAGVVAVDGTLTTSGGHAVRARADELQGPLLAVLVTHSHPDHYGGIGELVAGRDVPIVAAEGVDRVIRRDDPVKEEILRPMFGDEWPAQRTFPDRIASDGEILELGGVRFRLVDLGPGESPHDSLWVIEGEDAAFIGDQIYNRMHAYLADGHWERWLAHLDRLPAGATLYPGHGEPTSAAMADWQRGYITTFVDAVRAADWTDPERARAQVVARMTAYLPGDDLRFLMELSIEPMAAAIA